MSKIFITGANGFLGSHLTKRLCSQGHEVAIAVRNNANLYRFQLLGISPKVYSTDISGPESMEKIFEEFQPETVFHLASHGVRTSQSVERATLTANILGTFEVIRAAQKAQAKKVIILGSGFEYASSEQPLKEDAPLEPFSFYGIAKASTWRMARFLAQSSPTEIVLGRLFTAFGPLEYASRLFPFVSTKVLQNEHIRLTSGKQIRDYLYVDDVMSALLLLREKDGLNGTAVNICSGEPITIRQIAEVIAETAKKDKSLLQFGAIQDRPNEPLTLVGDCSKLKSLGWTRKFSLAEGISQTLEWYESHKDSWGRLS